MRYLGRYDPGATPALADLVAALTPATQAALGHLLTSLQQAQAAYEAAAPDVHGMSGIGLSAPERKALKAAYDDRTTKVRASLAAMLASLPAEHHDLCPYCCLDTGAELDHYLPKDRFPEFALHPGNLVPICGPCNKSKGSAVADHDGKRQFLFATRDRAGAAPLLRATLDFSAIVHAAYDLVPAAQLSQDEFALALRHFRRLGLGERYFRRANGYLRAMERRMRGLSAGAVRKAVLGASYVAEKVEEPNSWRRALHYALDREIDAVVTWLAPP